MMNEKEILELVKNYVKNVCEMIAQVMIGIIYKEYIIMQFLLIKKNVLMNLL